MLVKRAKENPEGGNMKYYKLEDSIIKKEAPDAKGVYFLGNIINGNFVIGYVGRSDNSLKSRLLNHNHNKKFKFFSFETVRTKRDGFLLETENWYLLKFMTINKIHPNKPKNLDMEHPCDVLGRFMKRKYFEVNKNA